METKNCSDCGKEFEQHQYNQGRCIECISNSDPRHDSNRLIKTCKGCGVDFKRQSPQQYYCSKECSKNNLYFINNYGITKRDFETIMELQDSKCKICGSEGFKINKTVKYNLVVDHDHETGGVRGLLCHNCNRGLGLFQDNKEHLAKATEYLSERATTIPTGSTPEQVEAQNKGKKRNTLDDIV